MAVSSTRIPFDTVATYNDKRNNNTVNIALHRISPPKQTQTPSAAAVMASNLRPMSSSISMASNFSCSSTVSSPQPPHLRVDKATITDPEDDEVGADDSNHTHSRGCQRQQEQKQQQPRKIKQKGRLLASVLQSLRNVFQWTTTSIGSGMKQSESFLVVDNGLKRRLGGYNKLSRDHQSNEEDHIEAIEDNEDYHRGRWSYATTTTTSSSSSSSSNGSHWLHTGGATDSHLSSPMELMDDESDHSWDDEELTCNVCDRAFVSPRQLEHHQQKKRHWGCNSCDSLFNTLMSLEHHKELYEHWSDDDYITDEDEDFEEDEDYEYELDAEYIRKMRKRASQEEAEFLQFQHPETSMLLL